MIIFIILKTKLRKNIPEIFLLKKKKKGKKLCTKRSMDFVRWYISSRFIINKFCMQLA